MGILGQFAVRGGNLSRIESRPTGERIGSYGRADYPAPASTPAAPGSARYR